MRQAVDSALWNAAIKGNAERVQQLIKGGANVNSSSYGWGTLLYCAALYKHVECLRIFIDNGCDINARTNSNGENVIHLAARGGSSECIQSLIDRGADVHAKAENGWTALHFAVLGGSIQCIQLLYDLGVDIDATDFNGKTAYDIAREFGQTDAAKLLQILSAYNVTDHQNTNPEADHLASDRQQMELDNEPEQPNGCMRCQCATCTDKENKINNVEKENVDLKNKMATMEERVKTIEELNSGLIVKTC